MPIEIPFMSTNFGMFTQFIYEHMKIYRNLTLYDPLLAFSYILGQFPIDCHMRIYKLYNHAKNCTHKGYYYRHF